MSDNDDIYPWFDYGPEPEEIKELEDLRNANINDREVFPEAKQAILQEIQDHDRQLLDRIDRAVLKIKLYDYSHVATPDISARYLGFNLAIDQVKTILKDIREGL